ncbi:response regulator [Oxalobacter formigenes]|uniref:KDP operon transcriptional regulatory protein KdpE n=1 Tax=Oxalobacter formigenes OXCC13 TaxID=556269 RepID=C3XCB9_OXAFO|nr:response regulator [Oxalobacter formigenes]ARQ44979.1 KDP operon transcriptional regulatory protein KdpE [Oxalobacter formigenes]ARQ77299.1 DNA-binding response regulator [Oxalobacter formigenes OXCC13]EEO30845.1 KDP operon transcriptional regulatory protein KdpE [Oxalobacter formigenes OXCC13]MCZ4062822.1 response regulator [Oxalobacter formigenes]QDX32167.1 response regulator [Oxalobacter formigenes]
MDNKLRILTIEDESNIRRFVKLALETEGYEVFEADGLKRGLIEAGTRRPDLVVLDLGLPDGDGLDFITDLRNWSDIPVIVLSARNSEHDKISALDAGADDYLEKPFGAGELLARVRAQLRRQQRSGNDPTIRFADVCIDPVRRLVEKNGEPVHLTPIEYRILTFLASQPDRVVTHQQLLKAVWGPGHTEDMHYIRVHMANLRKKVEKNASMPKHLVTEAGIGYRFVPDSK